MIGRLFHVFRNTPSGREIYLQSLYFCQQTGLSLQVYIPRESRFLLYLELDVVQVDLDNSYLAAPETAEQHARELAEAAGVKVEFFEPKDFTAATLPEVAVNFHFMTSPRSISDLSSKIGLGYVGPRVRVIVRSAPFPVLVPSSVFKKWHSLAVFLGGSANSLIALRHALSIHRECGAPVDLFTLIENGRDRAALEEMIDADGLTDDLGRCLRAWYVWGSGPMADHLYDVPHDALVVVGAHGHGLLKELLLGSTMEVIQSNLCNSLLVVGPKCRAPL